MAEAIEWATKATKNPSSRRVVLGKFDNGADTAYSVVAESLNPKATYFQLDNWDELLIKYNNDMDKMWEIDKQFLNNQWSQEKEFLFSHNPWEATGFFEKEVLHLIDLGVKDFVDIGGGLWKAVK